MDISTSEAEKSGIQPKHYENRSKDVAQFESPAPAATDPKEDQDHIPGPNMILPDPPRSDPRSPNPPLDGPRPPPIGPIPDGGLLAWLQVLGAFVIMIETWGLITSFGVYQTFYETVLLPGTSSSDISWIGSLQGALLMIGGIVSGPLFDKGYFRALMLSGLVLIILGMFMTSLCRTYWQVLLAQGICVGIGCGLVFLPSAAILSQYFARRRSIALGVQSAGSPLAGIIFPIIFSNLETRIGFGWATRVIAFILLGISVIPIVFLRTRAPPPERQRAWIDRTAFADKALRLWALGGIFTFMGLYVPFYYIQLYALQPHQGRAPIVSASFSAYLVTLLNAGSVFGRLLPSFLADYIDPVLMLSAVILGASVLAFGWFGVQDLGGTVVFTLLFGFFNGGVTSLPPSAIASLTPDLSRLGTRMGMCFTVIGVAILVGTPIAGAILGTTVGEEATERADERWDGLIGFTAATMLVGGVSTAVAWWLKIKRGKREKGSEKK
ncbi:MFS general substrate transporter [Xylariomycetidae sp. FL2044]|nr:MFS general substrate transporter [Xylariomycetidae sp. FL2044]